MANDILTPHSHKSSSLSHPPPSPQGGAHAWLTFVRERFKPGAYLPLIFVFTLMNTYFILQQNQFPFSFSRFAIALLVMISFFFRLRLFDEVKDAASDKVFNPQRPLARGLLSISQIKLVLLLLIILELSLTFILGPTAFLFHLLALFYSLLMYEEFFIGEWLRPHLTTYAVTHTFVSVLLGISSAVMVSNSSPLDWSAKTYCFFLINWCLFNLFEFARKTYHVSEERPGVETYSQLFGRFGAIGLSLSQALASYGLATWLLPSTSMQSFLLILFGIYFLISLFFVFHPTIQKAQFFRRTSEIYLFLHYYLCYLILKTAERF